jgi:hypothetical protein
MMVKTVTALALRLVRKDAPERPLLSLRHRVRAKLSER